jgi:PEP-CTERM/exosortase A-associated glycosyltransferase
MSALAGRIDELVHEIRPDLLHVHSPVLNAIPALRVGRRAGLPVLYEVRAFWEDAAVSHGTAREGGLRYRLSQMLEIYAVRRADAVTTICQGMRRDLIARGLAVDKVTVIPNAVDIQQFNGRTTGDTSLAQSLGLDGKTVLGFFGSFYAYEGLHVLLRALPRLLAQAPDLRVLLVGGGPEELNLKSLAGELGVSDKIVFTGRVSHGSVQDYYGLADLMVYPRLNVRLTDLVTPLKPLEAMAQGRIVLASDVGGHRELMDGSGVGHLFRANDPSALAEAVLRALAMKGAWPDEARRGQHYVARDRVWSRSVNGYRSVYAKLLGDPIAAGVGESMPPAEA